MAPVPYWLLRELEQGHRPTTEAERSRWIAALRVADPVRYDLIRVLTEYVIP